MLRYSKYGRPIDIPAQFKFPPVTIDGEFW